MQPANGVRRDGSSFSVPFSNSPKHHDTIGNRNTDPIALAASSYRHGVEYLRAALLILERRPDYATAVIVNLAFACELFFKSVLYAGEIDHRQQHNLHDLYEMLPGDCRDRIRCQFGSVPSSETQDFDLIMREIGDAFVFHRYAHERKAVVGDQQSILGLAIILEAEVRQSANYEQPA